MQGSLSSLNGIAGIIGPPMAASLFGYFIGAKAPVQIPGAAFFFSAMLVVGALLLAGRSFRKNKTEPALFSAPEPDTVSRK